MFPCATTVLSSVYTNPMRMVYRRLSIFQDAGNGGEGGRIQAGADGGHQPDEERCNDRDGIFSHRPMGLRGSLSEYVTVQAFGDELCEIPGVSLFIVNKRPDPEVLLLVEPVCIIHADPER